MPSEKSLDDLTDSLIQTAHEIFVASRFERHPTELAALQGKRVVVAQETPEGSDWSETKIKTLTGGDRITARFMRQDPFEYLPKYKIVISGNHKPALRTVDEAIRRRLIMIPFNKTIPKAQRDPDLPENLRAELSGIFQWILEGLVEYKDQGLNPPKSVLDATNEYFDDQDIAGQWIHDKCITGPDCKGQSSKLFSDYSNYANVANVRPGDSRSFKEKLLMAGFRPKGDPRARVN